MKTKRRQIKFLDPKEIDRIVAAIDPDPIGPKKKYKVPNLRDIALLETLFSTGMRIAEALSLQDALFARNVHGTLELDIVGKGGFQRTVYFSPKAQLAIKEYLFFRSGSTHKKDVGETRLFALTPRAVQIMLKKRAKAAGLDKKVTPHMYRHSFATDLFRNGVDIRNVQAFLGHQSIANTMIYVNVSNEKLKSIHHDLHK